MEDPNTWLAIFKTVGPWGAVAVGMAFFFWRLLVWMKPLGERLAEAHLNLVSSLQANDEKKTESLRVLQEIIEKDGNGHNITHGKLDKVEFKVDRLHEKLDRGGK